MKAFCCQMEVQFFLLDATKHFLSRMNEVRGGASVAHHPQLGLLVSGGWNDSCPCDLSSTELWTDGPTTFSAFTPLPIALSSHCVVALDRDDGEFFLAGGYSFDYNRRSFIHRGNWWDEVAPMPTERYGKKSKS